MSVKNVKSTIHALLDAHDSISNRDVVDALDHQISRQAVHHHLREMVSRGLLEPTGAGRAVRYRRAYEMVRAYPTDDLEESTVWAELRHDVPALAALESSALSLISYIVTKMVNNVIDHSGSEDVEVRVAVHGPRLRVEIVDHGVGVFARLVEGIEGLDDVHDAAQRLTIGKLTTDPERHTGEGIFFSSRGAHVFQIDANEVRLTMDNERGDWAIGRSERTHGSSVSFEVDTEHAMAMADLFGRFTGDDYEFDATSTRVALFETAVRFVSRSEAKRLAASLDRFRRVELDFAGVEEVGQGFVDELFRVWANDHPRTELIPINANPAVTFMIERGRPRA